MWLCMIFMVLPVVEPMKMGLLACSRGFGVTGDYLYRLFGE